MGFAVFCCEIFISRCKIVLLTIVKLIYSIQTPDFRQICDLFVTQNTCILSADTAHMSDIHTTQLAKFLAMRDADGLANYLEKLYNFLSHGSNTVMSESKQTEAPQIESSGKINHDCENRALFEACRDGVYDISEVLIQFGADVHHNSVDIACENSHPNIVKMLLRRGGNAPAISLMYALMAAMGKSDSVSDTFTDDRLICAKALVDAGARLDFAVCTNTDHRIILILKL